MKLTKQLRQDLETVKYFLDKAQKFIDRQDIEVCTKMLPENTSYYNKQGEGITPLTKWTGSELMYLINAKDRIKSILEADEGVL